MIFLRVELNGQDGLEIGKRIRQSYFGQNVKIVFISEHIEYAMKLFSLHPFDFMIDPIEKKFIDKLLDDMICCIGSYNYIFQFHNHLGFYRIRYDNIIYFYSAEKKIHVVTTEDEIEFGGKLSDIDIKTNGYFLSIHKSYLINFKYIQRYNYKEIIMTNGAKLNVSKPNRKRIRKLLQGLIV